MRARIWLASVALWFAGACHPAVRPPPARPAQPPPARIAPDHASRRVSPGPPSAGEPRLPASLHLLSWNLKHLGQGSKRLDLVAGVISHYDVAVLQEVMNPGGVHQLLGRLPGWAAAISPHAVGRRGYAEHYAVLYRTGLVRLQRSFTAADPGDRFAREPFVVCLAARAFDFCLVDIHIVFGSSVKPRDAEIEALGDVVAHLERTTRERDWLVVGDFNRPARAPSFAVLARRGWRMTSGAARLLTSLGRRGYSSDYDHLLLDPRYTREWRGDLERVDVIARACHGDVAWCIAHVSDHAPISTTFAIDGPDDD